MSLPQELAGSGDTAPWTAVNANSLALGSAFHFAHDLDIDSGLTVRITGGPLTEAITSTDTDLACTDNDDNYFVVAVATGVISTSTATTNWNSASYARIGIATFASGVLTYKDARCWSGGVLTGAVASGSGTVTSVAATVPSFLSISGSPITTTGTLAITYSGTALPVANGGTGATTLTANYVLLGNGTSAPQMIAPGTSGNVLTSNGTTWSSTAPVAGGTVTSVAASVPSFLSIAGSPVTTSGTLAISYSGTALPVANGGTGGTSASAARTALSAAALTQTTECIAGFIATVADKDYRIVVKAPHAGTATETTTRSESGTATFTFKINTTAFGGTANSVSSSEQSQAHASANAWSAGDDIVITASSNSACLGASFSIAYTRTLE